MKGIYLVLIFVLISCGHGQLEFQSFPEKVDVSVVEKDGQIKKLGQTPLDIDMENVFFSDGAVKLVFTKIGYRDETVYLTKPALKSRVKISTKMQEANSAKEIISNQKLEKLSNKIAEAQRYSFSKNYKRAESILLNVIEDFPDVSVPYDLLANIYYLSNNTNKALHFYEKAKGIAPGNPQRDYLINKLKRDGGRTGETQL
jgi:tetratricopeptide (TPR) repeat protein